MDNLYLIRANQAGISKLSKACIYVCSKFIKELMDCAFIGIVHEKLGLRYKGSGKGSIRGVSKWDNSYFTIIDILHFTIIVILYIIYILTGISMLDFLLLVLGSVIH